MPESPKSSPFVNYKRQKSAYAQLEKVTAHVAVDVYRLSVWALDRVIRILPSETLSLLLERLDGRIRPPVPKPSSFIVLRARVIERMTEFMRCNGTESTIVQVIGPCGAEEWWLQDTSREDNFAVRGRVVGIDELRDHFPFASVSLLAQPVPRSSLGKHPGSKSVGEEIVVNIERRKVSLQGDRAGDIGRSGITNLDEHSLGLPRAADPD